jgi:hypothetical protein
LPQAKNLIKRQHAVWTLFVKGDDDGSGRFRSHAVSKVFGKLGYRIILANNPVHGI